ncbi:MAG TPA: Z1 domain-containing protein [archaeon]|nr:Z1 domain-containing protein [archaeon]
MTDTIGLEPAQEMSKWNIEIDVPEVNFLRKRYSRIPEDEFNRTLRSAASILAKCPAPSSSRAKITGLAIGKVQSGKTLSFTTLIALAAANGYTKIIVLAGTKNALLNQTNERLKKDLGGADPEVASRIHVYLNPQLLNSVGIQNTIYSGKCALLVVLKQKGHLSNATKLLVSTDMPKGPTLIIDDEGDEASLNTYFRRGEESVIYKSIKTMRSVLLVHAYVAYTATPQANLLLDAIDDLSANFCELIDPGRGYCGGSVFFGDRFNDFVRPIDDVDDEFISGSMPESLKDALAIFFVGAAVRHSRHEGQKHSMLIHMTERTEGHKQMTESVKRLLVGWTDTISLRSSDPAKIELISRFKRAYTDLSKTVKNCPSWENIEERILKELKSYEPHMVNSLQQGVQIAETTFQHENNIVIGGNILGRGVTIQDLTVSYMARRAQRTQVDTMEQRARWFGYKTGYLDLCRIYLRSQIIDDYRGILRHEDDFWESLQRNILQGISLKDWPRFFRLDSKLGLNPTRSSVAKYRKFQPEGWDTQNRAILNPQIVTSNRKVIEDFFSKRNPKDEKIGPAIHKFIRNCPVSDVIKNLLQKVDVSDAIWDLQYFIEYLHRLSTENKLKDVDVVMMNSGFPRARELYDKNVIQIMQGPQANYPGDKGIVNDTVQLQIHIIKCMTKDKKEIATTTAMAIYIPKNEQYDMSYIVRGENNDSS